MVKISLKFLSLIAAASLASGQHIRSCKADKTIALTFDDGPTEYTSKLIDKLNKHHIKATFFINAHNYSPYADESKTQRDVIKKAYESGHQIASHTYSHYLPTEYSEMKTSLRKMDKFVKDIIGVTPRFLRAPGGNCEGKCVENVESLGYRLIKWDVDTRDWKEGSSGAIPVLREYFNKRSKNYLVLMHDSVKSTVEDTVSWIINSGIGEKYKFVTVAECLGDSKKYKESSSSSSSSSSSTKTTTRTTTKTTTTTSLVGATETISANSTVVTVSDTLVSPTQTVIDGNADSGFNLANNTTIGNNAAKVEGTSGTIPMISQSITLLMISIIFVVFNYVF